MEKIVLEISSSSDESDKENSSPLRDPEILTYHIQPSITLKESDYERLDPEKYLNDNLVDFFIRWFINQSNKKCFYAFNSFFFKTLDKDGYGKVSKWTKSELFNKNYWLVPIAIKEHWVLLVVCHAKRLFEKKKPQKPVILLFDSLSLIEEDIGEPIRYFVANEWARKENQDYSEISEEELPLIRVNIPQQDNQFDCGVYLIYYAKSFVENPLKYEKASSSNFDHLFDLSELYDGRLHLKNIINQYAAAQTVKPGVNIFIPRSLLSKKQRKKSTTPKPTKKIKIESPVAKRDIGNIFMNPTINKTYATRSKSVITDQKEIKPDERLKRKRRTEVENMQDAKKKKTEGKSDYTDPSGFKNLENNKKNLKANKDAKLRGRSEDFRVETRASSRKSSKETQVVAKNDKVKIKKSGIKPKKNKSDKLEMKKVYEFRSRNPKDNSSLTRINDTQHDNNKNLRDKRNRDNPKPNYKIENFKQKQKSEVQLPKKRSKFERQLK